MKIYRIIKKLESYGYIFKLKPNHRVKIILKSDIKGPDPEEVRPLFQVLKENKPAVIRELKNREMLSQLPDWFVIRSELLDGEKIFFRKNDSIKIPYKYNDLESYTYLEGKILLNDDMEKEDLKELHTIKKMFQGTFILANMEEIKK